MQLLSESRDTLSHIKMSNSCTESDHNEWRQVYAVYAHKRTAALSIFVMCGLSDNHRDLIYQQFHIEFDKHPNLVPPQHWLYRIRHFVNIINKVENFRVCTLEPGEWSGSVATPNPVIVLLYFCLWGRICVFVTKCIMSKTSLDFLVFFTSTLLHLFWHGCDMS